MDGSLDVRTCGDATSRCTACCKTHPLDKGDDGFLKPPSLWCPSASIGKGCKLHSNPTRPCVCSTFACDWLKGKGEQRDRPDATRVVLETQVGVLTVPVLLMWEVTDGALDRPHATKIRDTTVCGGTPVLSIYCNGNRKLRIPQRLVDSQIVDCEPILELGIAVEIDLPVRPLLANLLSQ